jgi:DNA-binding NtrC family response regulator
VASVNLNGQPRVMVVDDDPAMRAFVASFLAKHGYHAITMGNARDAVQRYQDERPDAVILDMVMPGDMDGLAALAAFKKIDREVPIIVLSGQGRTTTVVQAMKLGAQDFVSKPFEEADLEVPLANALRQRQLSRDVASLRDRMMHLLMNDDWPGNIREVENLIKRTVALAGEAPIQSPDAATGPVQSAPLSPTAIASAALKAGNYSLKDISRTAAREAERELIFTTLQRTRWNRKATAEILGISYKALLYKIQQSGLSKAS